MFRPPMFLICLKCHPKSEKEPKRIPVNSTHLYATTAMMRTSSRIDPRTMMTMPYSGNGSVDSVDSDV